MRSRLSPNNIEAKLVAVQDADRTDLLILWGGQFDVPPPRKISTGLLRRAVAYNAQEQAYGGLRPALRTYLREVAAQRCNGVGSAGDAERRSTSGQVSLPAMPPTASDLPAGSRLVREWNGELYEVVIEGDGAFSMNGARYQSLTAIARLITGTAWSGPRFFGLVKVKCK